MIICCAKIRQSFLSSPSLGNSMCSTDPKQKNSHIEWAVRGRIDVVYLSQGFFLEKSIHILQMYNIRNAGRLERPYTGMK